MPITALARRRGLCGSDDDGGRRPRRPPATEAPTDRGRGGDDRGPGVGSGAPSSEPAAAAFQVPTDACPPEATTALADGETDQARPSSVPQTGPLAAFGVRSARA